MIKLWDFFYVTKFEGLNSHKLILAEMTGTSNFNDLWYFLLGKYMSEKINEHSYNVYPFWYDIRGFLILSFSYRNTLFRQMKFFAENFKGKHLECAIGTATLTMFCMIYKKLFGSNDTYQMVGVDYSEALLKGARRKLRKSEVLKEDLRQMSFADETFDSANFPNGYHTLEGADIAMKEIVRVLKKDGTLYVNILLYPKSKLLDGISRRINKYGMHSGILKRPYTIEECRQMPEKFGLSIIDEKIHQNCVYLKLKKL